MYEGSGPADDDDDEDVRALGLALSCAERDSSLSRQGKLRAGFEGAGEPEKREVDEEKRRECGACADDEVSGDVGVYARNGLCSRRLANRRD